MVIETEAKIKIERQDFDRIVNLIGPLNFEIQQNHIYDIGEGFLRIRFEKWKTYLTHKGKRGDGKYNSREEREMDFEGDRFEEFKNYFSFLGEGFSYEKSRAYFELNDCILCLDNLSNGETYIEVEGHEEGIDKNLDFLGLLGKEIEKKSYQEILGNGLH